MSLNDLWVFILACAALFAVAWLTVTGRWRWRGRPDRLEDAD